MSSDTTSIEICLIDSGIKSLSDLKLPSNLLYLNLHCNQVKAIDSISHLKNLKHLDLSSNEIVLISGLSQCHCLQSVNLASNQIQKILGLENLRTLKALNLSFNLITDISGLKYFSKATHNLTTVELFGNKISSLNHVTRSLISSTSIKNLYFIKDSDTNPVCSLPSYRPSMLAQLPWLQNLDGFDKHGNRVPDEMFPDIPGLDDYLQFLQPSLTSTSSTALCESSLQSSTEENVMTPKINAVLEKFKQRKSFTKAAQEDDNGGTEFLDKEDYLEKFLENNLVNGRLDSLEDKLATLVNLYIEQQEVSKDQLNKPVIAIETSSTSGSDSDVVFQRRNEEKKHQMKQKAIPSKEKKFVEEKSCDTHESKLHVIGTKKNVSKIDKSQKKIRSADDDETYLSLMQELDAERERRWKAEQASRKLLDNIKKLQERSIEDRRIQEAAITNGTKLKQALNTEATTRLQYESNIKILMEENTEFQKKVVHLEKVEMETKQMLKELQEMNQKLEKERFEEDMHNKKQLQAMQLDVGGTRRELEMLRTTADKQKSHIQQLQELLISREQEHKILLTNMVHIDSKEMWKLIEQQTTKSEARNGEVLKQMEQRLSERDSEYAALEDEFRMALQIEANRYNELYSMYDGTTTELQELKTTFEAVTQNEAKAKTLITELSTLVKEQKAKITEMVKSKQEMQVQYKDRFQQANEELICLRKVSSKVESLSQDKERMAAHIKGQESLIHGLRSERKLWGQELAQQGASLAQERGRLDVQLESQQREVKELREKLLGCNDSLRIKSKLIDDQTETIKKMKQDLLNLTNANKRLSEDEQREITFLNNELEKAKQDNAAFQDEITELNERKAKLKDDLTVVDEELEKSRKEHKKLRGEWDERSKMIDVLEQRVSNMKTNYEEREKQFKTERDEAFGKLKIVTDQIRACEERHRLEISTTQHNYELEIRKVTTLKDDEIQKLQEQVTLIEDEMREILSQSANQKRNLEERVKQLSKALQSIHLDLT